MKSFANSLIRATVFCTAVLLGNWIGGASLSAAPVTINFDSLNATGLPSGLSGAPLANYLGGFGLSLTNVTPGTQVTVYDARDVYSAIQPIAPTSPFNIITQIGSNTAVSFTLQSNSALDSFSLTRPLIHPGATGIALPFWQATALNAQGNSLGSVGENARSIFGADLPAQIFNLNGPGIAAIRFDGNAFNFAAFSTMPFDNFVINVSASVPEPSSVVLFGISALALGMTRLRGRQRVQL